MKSFISSMKGSYIETIEPHQKRDKSNFIEYNEAIKEIGGQS